VKFQIEAMGNSFDLSLIFRRKQRGFYLRLNGIIINFKTAERSKIKIIYNFFYTEKDLKGGFCKQNKKNKSFDRNCCERIKLI
jgi:hypothetical protein